MSCLLKKIRQESSFSVHRLLQVPPCNSFCGNFQCVYGLIYLLQILNNKIDSNMWLIKQNHVADLIIFDQCLKLYFLDFLCFHHVFLHFRLGGKVFPVDLLLPVWWEIIVIRFVGFTKYFQFNGRHFGFSTFGFFPFDCTTLLLSLFDSWTPKTLV